MIMSMPSFLISIYLIQVNDYILISQYMKQLTVEISFLIVYVVLLVYAYFDDTHHENISDEYFYYSGLIIIIACFLCFILYSLIDI
jgi:hypothetical protein